jgi:hypothetical protein
MASMTKRSFPHIQCMSVRMQGVKFNKKMSRRAAKWIIFVVSLLTIVNVIHEPIHRRVIDNKDDDE